MYWCCELQGFPGGANDKEPACQCRRHKRHGLDPWVGKISWRRAWQPTPVLLPQESRAQRSLGRLPPVHGIFQARILKWVVISFSRGIFQTQGLNPHLLCLLHRQADSLPLSHPVFYYLCDLVPVTFEASSASFAKRGFDEMTRVNFLAEFPAHRKQLHKQLLFFNWIPMSVPRPLDWDRGQLR